MTNMTKQHYVQADGLEWVSHSYLLDLVRERDEAEARAVQAESAAAVLVNLLAEYADRIAELKSRLKGGGPDGQEAR